MATIQLQQVEKKFGDVHAVQPVDMTIGDGEFVVLLGPSGCGKTTTLRMIAGLETVTAGNILLNGRDVTHLRGRERDIAFVFQLFALYPHMTVRQNVAFPLETQGEKRDAIDKRVREVVQMLGIDPLLNLRPGALSGGDRQRVALARALVRRPAAFLMDEPLGALDAEFREVMRAEIKRLHLAEHATTVYVTHDQVEAMAMGDRIVVMSNAVIQQIGTPHEVYTNPANLFVARFIGSPGMNLLTGRYADGHVQLSGGGRYAVPETWRTALDGGYAGQDVVVGFRPEAARVVAAGTADRESSAGIPARVYAADLHGAYTMLHLAIDGQEGIVHTRAGRATDYPIDTPVRFDLDPELVRFFDPKSEVRIQKSEVGTAVPH
jgi:multiple sugar transport system ATP-binding protein